MSRLKALYMAGELTVGLAASRAPTRIRFRYISPRARWIRFSRVVFSQGASIRVLPQLTST